MCVRSRSRTSLYSAASGMRLARGLGGTAGRATSRGRGASRSFPTRGSGITRGRMLSRMDGRSSKTRARMPHGRTAPTENTATNSAMKPPEKDVEPVFRNRPSLGSYQGLYKGATLMCVRFMTFRPGWSTRHHGGWLTV